VVEGSRVQNILGSLTQKQGKKYNDPESVKEIEHFIDFYKVGASFNCPRTKILAN